MPTTLQTPRRLVPLLLGICLFAILPKTAHAQSLNEESLKANYILRFVDFVRWERPTNNPSKIGVINDSSLFRELSSVAEKKSSPTRSFAVIEIKNSSNLSKDLEGLDMIYVGRDQQQNLQRIVELSRKGSIITVSSEPGFLEAGGLIEFVTMQNRLRFSLNLIEVDSYNVGLSSKLAQLAVK